MQWGDQTGPVPLDNVGWPVLSPEPLGFCVVCLSEVYLEIVRLKHSPMPRGGSVGAKAAVGCFSLSLLRGHPVLGRALPLESACYCKLGAERL